VYKNEHILGSILSERLASTSLKRSDLFITSKIGPKDQGFERASAAIQQSLDNLGPSIGYIDLMLIHWPGSQKLQPTSPENAVNRRGTWDALKKAQKDGLVRAIGVPNYTLIHLQELDPPPAVNQIEFHPLVYNDKMRSLLAYCDERNIIVQGYGSLGEGDLVNGKIDVPEIKYIAQARECTPAQVLLQWSVRKGCHVIPKASSKERIQENWVSANVKLSEEVKSILSGLHAIAYVPKYQDIHTLDTLTDKKYATHKFCWDPETIL
jgi:diketogulonate reductase-like aldo/keto reductase